MDKPRLPRLLPSTFVVVLWSCALFAQAGNQGSLEGTVTDPDGALVPGARLQITHRETSFAATTLSDQHGLYRFPVIPVGAYLLTAQKESFAQVIYNNVAVAVGARVTLPIRLTVSPHAESVTVAAETPLLERTRASASAVVDARALSALPVNGRDYAQFVLLTPNVTRDVRGGLSFSGLRGMNSVLVDGADADNSFWGQPLGASGFDVRGPYQFSQEAIHEFQVNTNNYSAELGRAGGAVINAVTKSGGNQFHGAAFWYYRDQSLNAKSAVDRLNVQPKLPFHVNQFGANLGGPLLKGRLFFFFNFDGQRSTVSNAAFLQLPSGFQLSSIAEVRGFQQLALDFLAPRVFSWSRPDEQNDFFAKFDGRISPRHRLSGFWNRQRRFGGRAPRLPTETFEHNGPVRNDTDQVVASWTATASHSVINVARLNFVDGTQAFLTDGINPEASIFEGGQLVTSIGRFPGPQSNRIYRWQGADTVTWQHGRHTFKAGGDLLRDRVDFSFAQNFSGAYRFRSLASFGRSLAGTPQYLLGDRYVQSFSTEDRAGLDLRPDIFELAGFFQDEWRIRPGLALNLGARYDLQRSARPPVSNPSAVLEGAGLDTASRPEDAGNVAPRIGIAWSPQARLVVRAGYGIFFGRTIAALNSQAHFYNDVSVVTRTLTGGSPSAPFIPSYPNSLCGLPNPEGASPSCAPPAAGAGNAVIMLFVRDYTQPYTQQANLGFELELFKDATVALSYAFVRGTHLPRVRDVNLRTPTISAALPIAGTTTLLGFERYLSPRPLAGFDRVMAIESTASSMFHGMTLEVKRRFSHRFQANLSYTLGKAIDDGPSPYNLNPAANFPGFPAYPSDPRADRSVGLNDHRHRLVFSAVWEPDYGRGLPRAARFLLRDWQVSGILDAQSGHPYSGVLEFDLNNDGNSASDRTPGQGRNAFYLPSLVSLNPRLTRTIRFSERMNLQLIWEAFNVLNRANISGVRNLQFAASSSLLACGTGVSQCLVPQTSAPNAFGTPTATTGPRTMQLAARLVF